MNDYCFEHSEKAIAPGEECDKCRTNFEKHSSICHCGQEVTNAAFFKRSSPHFKGTCIPWGTPKGFKIPERTVDKPMPYPWPKGFRDPFPGKYLKPWPSEDDKWLSYIRAPHEGEGRWIKALFASKCSDCSTEIKANVRAFYYRECRAILCQDCGSRAAKGRWAA